MEATQLLRQQHEEVESLFKEFENAKSEQAKLPLFEKIADDLAAHAEIEEKIFYPAVYVGDLKDPLKEAVEEHLAVKRVIADLLQMEPGDENFDAKVKVLQDLIEHHVEEEHEELFPKVKKNFTAEELEALGAEMEEMFLSLRSKEPRKNVPAQTAEAAPLD